MTVTYCNNFLQHSSLFLLFSFLLFFFTLPSPFPLLTVVIAKNCACIYTCNIGFIANHVEGEFGKVDIRNTSNYNTVYVGVRGAPQLPKVNAPQMVSDIPQTDRVAEKPFLVEENGKWFVYATWLGPVQGWDQLGFSIIINQVKLTYDLMVVVNPG